MPRVNVVEKSRKEVRCSRCGEVVPAGETYKWIKPRYGSKRIRCKKFGCRFRPTDLSSAKTAVIEKAIEDAEDQISNASDHSEIQDILAEVATCARDVGEEYRDASSAWASGYNAEFEEKADSCESFADELESWSFSGETDEEEIRKAALADAGKETDHDGAADIEDGAWESALDEMREEAISALHDTTW